MEFDYGILTQVMATSLKLKQCYDFDKDIAMEFIKEFPKPSADKVRKCLEMYGWEQQAFPNPNMVVFTKKDHRIAFPAGEEFDGFVRGVATITETVAAIEGISPLMMFKSMC